MYVDLGTFCPISFEKECILLNILAQMPPFIFPANSNGCCTQMAWQLLSVPSSSLHVLALRGLPITSSLPCAGSCSLGAVPHREASDCSTSDENHSVEDRHAKTCLCNQVEAWSRRIPLGFGQQTLWRVDLLRSGLGFRWVCWSLVTCWIPC